MITIQSETTAETLVALNPPIGFIQAEAISHHGSPFRHPQELLYVNIVVVLPDYRGKGVGRRLMEEVFRLARGRRITRVELDHWEGNDAALAFDKLGFRPYRHYMAIEIHADKPQT
jgi:GNAT superfamily N-acetyltransferase